MPDRHEGPKQGTSTDLFMTPIVLALIALVAAVLALAAGLTWKGLLHWAGELLLIIGIALAATGISDVRREWTQLPGIRGRLRQAARTVKAHAASFMWAGWNRVVQWAWLARRLHLRAHGKVVYGSAALSSASTMTATATVEVGWGVPPANGATEERLAWLEDRMVRAGQQIRTLNTWHDQEVRDRQAATEDERAARMAEDQRIRERMADLAGGGLRLQTWGVACLLAGTLITAIW